MKILWTALIISTPLFGKIEHPGIPISVQEMIDQGYNKCIDHIVDATDYMLSYYNEFWGGVGERVHNIHRFPMGKNLNAWFFDAQYSTYVSDRIGKIVSFKVSTNSGAVEASIQG